MVTRFLTILVIAAISLIFVSCPLNVPSAPSSGLSMADGSSLPSGKESAEDSGSEELEEFILADFSSCLPSSPMIVPNACVTYYNSEPGIDVDVIPAEGDLFGLVEGRILGVDLSCFGVYGYIEYQHVWYSKLFTPANTAGEWIGTVVTNRQYDPFASRLWFVAAPLDADPDPCWPELCLERPEIDGALAFLYLERSSSFRPNIILDYLSPYGDEPNVVIGSSFGDGVDNALYRMGIYGRVEDQWLLGSAPGDLTPFDANGRWCEVVSPDSTEILACLALADQELPSSFLGVPDEEMAKAMAWVKKELPQPSGPEITLTQIPPYGDTTGFVQAHVSGIDPLDYDEYQVVFYIRINVAQPPWEYWRWQWKSDNWPEMETAIGPGGFASCCTAQYLPTDPYFDEVLVIIVEAGTQVPECGDSLDCPSWHSIADVAIDYDHIVRI